MDSLRKSIRKSLRKSLSLRRTRASVKDTLSNDVVKYKGISLSALVQLRDGILDGSQASGIEIYELVEDVEDSCAGDTVQFLAGDRCGGEWEVLLSGSGIEKKRAVLDSGSVRMKERKDWSIEDVCEFVVLPQTWRNNEFYLDCVSTSDVGQPFQGAFVSQARKSSFDSLVRALEDHYMGEDRRKVFLWLDIFCANQPLLKRKGQRVEELISGLHRAIENFNERLIFFNSWDNPYPLQRAWCIWEIYGAAASGKTLDIIFDQAATEDVVNKLFADSDRLLKAIADLDPRKMQCRDHSDLEMIRHAVEQLPGGFSNLKAKITARLRSWLISTVEDAVKRRGNQNGNERDESFAGLLKHAAHFMRLMGEKDKALAYFSRAKNIYCTIHKTERHQDVGGILGAMANVYRFQGMYDEALEMYRQALDILKETLGERHSSTASTYNNIAGVYDAQGKYDLALEMYEKGLEIKLETMGESHPDVANAYNNIGIVLTALEKYEPALEMLEKSLAIMQATFGERHPDTAGTYSNMAELYRRQGNFTKALEMYKRTLEIFTETLGEHHPATAGAYGNLGLVYFTMGEFELAMEVYEKALDIFKRAFGERHPAIGISYSNMGDVCKGQRDLEAALELYYKALEIKKQTLGERHPSTAVTEMNIGLVFELQGKIQLAHQQFLLALGIRRENLGPTHPSTLEVEVCHQRTCSTTTNCQSPK